CGFRSVSKVCMDSYRATSLRSSTEQSYTRAIQGLSNSRTRSTQVAQMSKALDLRIEWLPAPGVSTPELAATWARYEAWIDGRCVTQVEASDGTLRRSV